MLDTLEEPSCSVVDAGQKTATPMSVFNEDRECQFSMITHKNHLKFAADSWDVSLDDTADRLLVDIKVGVRKEHPRPDDLAPGDLGIGIADVV